MINLFIDTNIYVSLYGFFKQRLEEIRKITDQINNGRIVLWLPEQVINEFNRNKETIPLQTINKIKKMAFDYKRAKLPEIPEFEDNLNDLGALFDNLDKIKREINSKIEGIVASIIQNLKKESFPADKIVGELFAAAKISKHDDTIIEKARIRYDLGIPPGKEGSYGDAVIWETLLKEIPDEETLDFVGYDKDFRSTVDDKDFSPCLLKEWRQKKRSEIIPYERLGDFIKKRIPEIEHPDKIVEEEKRLNKRYLLTTPAILHAVGEAYRLSENINAASRSAIENFAASLGTPAMIRAMKDAYGLSENINAVSRSSIENLAASLGTPAMIRAMEEACRLSENLKASSGIEANTKSTKNGKSPFSVSPSTEKIPESPKESDAEEMKKNEKESSEKSEETKKGDKEKS